MNVALHNRRKLEDAMRRMLDGTIDAPDGKLTWKNVAIVAGVSKATADRAIDLRVEFRRLLADQQPDTTTSITPSSVPRARTDLDKELNRLRRDNAELSNSTKVLHSVILALVDENEQLRRRARRQTNVVALDTTQEPPPTA